MRKDYEGDYFPLTRERLQDWMAAYQRKGYGVSKWMLLAQTLLDEHYNLTLYDAKDRASRYLRVTRNGHPVMFKVRFLTGQHRFDAVVLDCDTFVGITDAGARSTEDALAQIRAAFKVDVGTVEYAELVGEDLPGEP